jgi:hypothetical protein
LIDNAIDELLKKYFDAYPEIIYTFRSQELGKLCKYDQLQIFNRLENNQNELDNTLIFFTDKNEWGEVIEKWLGGATEPAEVFGPKLESIYKALRYESSDHVKYKEVVEVINYRKFWNVTKEIIRNQISHFVGELNVAVSDHKIQSLWKIKHHSTIYPLDSVLRERILNQTQGIEREGEFDKQPAELKVWLRKLNENNDTKK